MTDIEWRDPPPPTPGPGTRPWMDRLTPLMERPGEWAMVHRASTRAATAASALRNREYHYPPGKWEFRSSHRELFARYIGPE